jgi:hypothetical protein
VRIGDAEALPTAAPGTATPIATARRSTADPPRTMWRQYQRLGVLFSGLMGDVQPFIGKPT